MSVWAWVCCVFETESLLTYLTLPLHPGAIFETVRWASLYLQSVVRVPDALSSPVGRCSVHLAGY
jgi:hypothetical protein